MLLTILAVIVAVIAIVLIVASTRPDSFRIERQITINASPDKPFALIQDFHRWTEWSPWEQLDPNLERTYSGAQSGPGAMYDWKGNSKAGTGHMEILEAVAPSRVEIRLDFIAPFEAHNIADFALTPEGGSTRVVWAMHGPQPFMNKLMSVFMNMDKLVGPDFEKGLAAIKRLSEA
ncbi:MAG: SRPBCC family protein [Vicinamibacteria bacterium]